MKLETITAGLAAATAAAAATAGTAAVLAARLRKQFDVTHVNGMLIALRVDELDARNAANMLFFAPTVRESPELMTRDECAEAFEALTPGQRVEMMRMLR